jgi:hypothetical protein
MKVIHIALLPNHPVFSIYYKDNDDAVKCLNNNEFFKETIYDYSIKTLRRNDLGKLVFVRNVCIHKQLTEYFKNVHSFIKDMYLVMFKGEGTHKEIKKYCIPMKYYRTATWKIAFTDTLELYKKLWKKSYATHPNIGSGWTKFRIKSQDNPSFLRLRDYIEISKLKVLMYLKLTLKKEVIVCSGWRNNDFMERLGFLVSSVLC